MSTSTITVGGQSVTLVSWPTSAGLKGYAFTIEDKVGYVPSVFTGQPGQTQSWPGADLWSSTLTIAPLNSVQADDWTSFLMELRGMANAFQLGDVRKATPRGTVAGSPVASGASSAMVTSLATRGWTPGAVFKRGNHLQIGYRLYQNLNDATADGSGNATLSIWPSLREAVSDGTAIVTSNTKGLWRLAKNQRSYSYDVTRLTRGISIPIMEYR